MMDGMCLLHTSFVGFTLLGLALLCDSVTFAHGAPGLLWGRFFTTHASRFFPSHSFSPVNNSASTASFEKVTDNFGGIFYGEQNLSVRYWNNALSEMFIIYALLTTQQCRFLRLPRLYIERQTATSTCISCCEAPSQLQFKYYSRLLVLLASQQQEALAIRTLASTLCDCSRNLFSSVASNNIQRGAARARRTFRHTLLLATGTTTTSQQLAIWSNCDTGI